MKPYKRPILTVFLEAIGVIVLIVGGIAMCVSFAQKDMAFGGISLGITLFTCVVYFGFAQIIDYLGRSAFYAEQSFTALQRIAGSGLATAAATSKTAASIPGKSAAPAPVAESTTVYRVARGTEELGSYTRQQIRQRKAAGKLSDADYYWDEHAGDWMTLDLLA